MANARDLCRGHKQLLPLVEYALKEGWTVSRTPGGHLRFVKPGLPPIYTSSTVSDHRGGRNAQAMLKRAQRQAASDKTEADAEYEGDRYG
ncbi:type II toxin-antitoxin system HicA family toxin [Pseudomonas chlororaphis]|uniref:type II toxin-antitoxin system HicA family toxin n=1 Tax=Pseudomonas chlororaphis TaxID=587753 RepID=UPI00046E5B86|nr:type II toxin-antitoxin system HicA family toxin [Pseudomonas chlororaphis]